MVPNLEIKKLYKWSYIVGSCLACVLLIFIFVVYFLPLPDVFSDHQNLATTKIYDRNGVLLYEILQPEEGKKSLISVNNLPKNFVNATLAAEDINYYEHGGVDPYSLMRAIYLNVRHGKIISGGSTITQQLVRNMLGVQQKRTYEQKLLESIYALRLNQMYSKEEVFELYLNKIYYGNLSYGVEAAALNYFGKHAYDLDLAESAILAGIPQSPSNYNPLTNFDLAKKRQKYVLEQMKKYDLINQNEYQEAIDEKIHFRASQGSSLAPHFVQMVINHLEEEYGEEKVHYGGLKVYTTLDSNYQLLAEKIARQHVTSLADHNVTNAAVLAIDVKSGQILTWLGSVNYFDEDIDGAVDMLLALRQPGSSIKPFNYLLALEKDFTPATVIYDIETQFRSTDGAYTPQNYGLDYHGMVRLREALASSLNISAVKVLEHNGVADFKNFLIKFGFDSLDQSPEFYGLALTLGGAEVRLKNLAEAYLALANFGNKKETSYITKIEDADSKVIYEWQNFSENFLLGEYGKQHAYQIINILQDANARLIGFGEDSILEIGRPAAVKTGTTRNFKDNVTVGFTPEILVATWTGNADASPMYKISGIDGAAPIWHDFLTSISRNIPISTFDIPDKLKQVEICEISGKKPTEYCKQRVLEWFVDGTEPTEYDDIYKQFLINPMNGLSYNNCLSSIDASNLKKEIMMVFPQELTKWVLDHKLPLPPLSGCLNDASANNENDQQVVVVKPSQGDEFLLDNNVPLAQQKLLLNANFPSGTKSIDWYVDNVYFTTSKTPPFSVFWQLKQGTHSVEAHAKAQNGQIIKSNSVSFFVKETL